jgi:hypothetical protein
VPLQLSRKSAMRFFLFPKVQASGQSPNDTPVYLNVYDLTPMNGYIYWAGLGIFHSGIEGSFLCHIHLLLVNVQPARWFILCVFFPFLFPFLDLIIKYVCTGAIFTGYLPLNVQMISRYLAHQS